MPYSSAIDVLIPYAAGTHVRPEVLESLSRQDGYSLRIVTEETDPPRGGDEPLYSVVCRARNRIKRRIENKYVLLLDADVAIPDGAITAGLAYLSENPVVAVVSFPYLPRFGPGHVTFGASLWHSHVLEALDFHTDGSLCECIWMMTDIALAFRKAVYHPTVTATHYGD